MRSAYRILAHSVAGLVAVQAAVMVFAVAGLYGWIEDGNTLTESTMTADEPPDFTGAIGFMLHGILGMTLIPLLALALLIISFFAKIPGGVGLAAAVVLLVVLQVALGIFGHETPYAGLLHGLNALILFGAATQAGRRASLTDEPSTAPEAASVR